MLEKELQLGSLGIILLNLTIQGTYESESPFLLWWDGEVVNTVVCKTISRGFESHSHLQIGL